MAASDPIEIERERETKTLKNRKQWETIYLEAQHISFFPVRDILIVTKK